MKDSFLKIAVLALLLVVFTAVVITARWADESDYDHITRPSEEPERTSSKISSPPPQQLSHLNAWADVGATGREFAFSAGQAGRLGDNLDETQQQAGSADSRSSHLSEEPDEDGEPPDNSKHTYGSDDVE